jgi:hypothetical protein
VFEQIHEHRRPWRAAVVVSVEQGPDLVAHPADADRSRAGLEDVLVDERFAASGRRIDLDG